MDAVKEAVEDGTAKFELAWCDIGESQVPIGATPGPGSVGSRSRLFEGSCSKLYPIVIPILKFSQGVENAFIKFKFLTFFGLEYNCGLPTKSRAQSRSGKNCKQHNMSQFVKAPEQKKPTNVHSSNKT